MFLEAQKVVKNREWNSSFFFGKPERLVFENNSPEQIGKNVEQSNAKETNQKDAEILKTLEEQKEMAIKQFVETVNPHVSVKLDVNKLPRLESKDGPDVQMEKAQLFYIFKGLAQFLLAKGASLNEKNPTVVGPKLQQLRDCMEKGDFSEDHMGEILDIDFSNATGVGFYRDKGNKYWYIEDIAWNTGGSNDSTDINFMKAFSMPEGIREALISQEWEGYRMDGSKMYGEEMEKYWKAATGKEESPILKESYRALLDRVQKKQTPEVWVSFADLGEEFTKAFIEGGSVNELVEKDKKQEIAKRDLKGVPLPLAQQFFDIDLAKGQAVPKQEFKFVENELYAIERKKDASYKLFKVNSQCKLEEMTDPTQKEAVLKKSFEGASMAGLNTFLEKTQLRKEITEKGISIEKMLQLPLPTNELRDATFSARESKDLAQALENFCKGPLSAALNEDYRKYGTNLDVSALVERKLTQIVPRLREDLQFYMQYLPEKEISFGLTLEEIISGGKTRLLVPKNSPDWQKKIEKALVKEQQREEKEKETLAKKKEDEKTAQEKAMLDKMSPEERAQYELEKNPDYQKTVMQNRAIQMISSIPFIGPFLAPSPEEMANLFKHGEDAEGPVGLIIGIILGKGKIGSMINGLLKKVGIEPANLVEGVADRFIKRYTSEEILKELKGKEAGISEFFKLTDEWKVPQFEQPLTCRSILAAEQITVYTDPEFKNAKTIPQGEAYQSLNPVFIKPGTIFPVGTEFFKGLKLFSSQEKTNLTQKATDAVSLAKDVFNKI